jgi:hypothetical protein
MMLDPKKVTALFETETHHADVLVEIFKMIYPEWDSIAKIDGYPRCSRETNRELMRLFIEFDNKHHPGCIRGGAWMNYGFSTAPESSALQLWEVLPAPVILKPTDVSTAAPEQRI